MRDSPTAGAGERRKGMKEQVYNKLVRDNVPDIIREQGGTPVIHTLDEIGRASCMERV